jgi:hypothetical protein
MKPSQCKTFLILALALPGVMAAQKRENSGIESLRNDFKIDTDRPARLRVDVDAGEIRVEKGSSRNKMEVDLHYNKDHFRHSLRFNETRNEMEIVFEKEGWLEYDHDRTIGELMIALPTEGELELDFKIKAGKIDLQLGGLRITELALETIAGEVNVDFEEPNRMEMANLYLNTKIGESKFRRLGNARFRDAEINGGIGELTIDFSGEMLADANARVDLDIGETMIVLPRDAGTRLSMSKFLFLSHVNLPFELQKEGRYYYSENYDRASRTFQLRVSSGLGECRVELQ